MARKNLLEGLDELTAVNSSSPIDPASIAAPNPRPTLGARGAVGAMGRSLERISANIDAAKALEQQMLAGAAVVEIDVSLIDSSFVLDRMSENSIEHSPLIESIRDHGQQVPILVRPHPEVRGRYQVAYGHRRLRALQELKRNARAVVRQLTDEELVVAQGQENSARRDLSFIERASFAATLEDRGFSRETIIAALTVDKTELSRLISSRRALPDDLVFAIGPAPKTGRRRWMDLADRLRDEKSEKQWRAAIIDAGFHGADSDTRFLLVLRAVSSRARTPETPRAAEKSARWIDHDGQKIGRIEDDVDWLRISVDKTAAADFGTFLLAQLPELLRAYKNGKGDNELHSAHDDVSP